MDKVVWKKGQILVLFATAILSIFENQGLKWKKMAYTPQILFLISDISKN